MQTAFDATDSTAESAPPVDEPLETGVSTTTIAGVTLVRVELRSTVDAELRVRVANELAGPVLPPCREGVPEAGWDADGFRGVVPASGRLGVGYACPVSTPDEDPTVGSDPDPESSGIKHDADAVSIELLGPEMRSGLGALLLVHGAFVVGLGTWLRSELRVERPWSLLAALAAVVVVGTRIGFAALAVSVPLLVIAWVGLRTAESLGYEAVLVVAGAGLATIVELVYVNEQAGPGRMNTVFKTYSQVWVFWGTAMGVALSGLVLDTASRVGSRMGSNADSQSRSLGDSLRVVAVVALVIALVASTSVYGVLALGAHFDRGPAGGPTLDATQFVETDHPDQAAAIDWIDDRDGQPTLLEAPGTLAYIADDGRSRAMYSWNANPASSLTGVPTVAGWQHEIGYRGADAYAARVGDVDAMYTGTESERAALLSEYEVRYIWVGPSERARYGSVAFGSEAIEVAHRSGDVTIYEVDLDALDG